MIELPVQPLTAAAFAPYGSVIDAATATPAAPAASPGGGDGGAAVVPINAGTAWRHEAVPALDLHRAAGRAVLAVYQAQARSFPFVARMLERHRLSDQVFLPLAGPRRCIVLVAPAHLAAPRASDCAAFLTTGHQGIRLSAGTWHHPLLALDAGPWAVLERRAEEVDCEEVGLGERVRVGVR